ncbi:sortase [Adlercreutzia sp. R21]|uniref:sortase domain-containing protein n=1 Tax=Adlercreutzia wanghongyangiae TaxID=3111451 RepID=UPI002DB9AF0F|nr:sortase [Adlercreutzia sp. R21]MEC4184652.1 sortase [Adlercreutzia sp. R21]
MTVSARSMVKRGIQHAVQAGLCALVGVFALGMAPLSAWADETTADARPSSAGPVTQGVCEALGFLQGRIDSRGQEVLDEQALEHARRSDSVAEQLRLQAMNSKGQQYGAAAEAEAERARQAQLEAEAAAAEAASQIGQNSTVNETTPAAPTPRTNTIYFHGEYIPFVQGNPADMTAPKSRVASTWIGEGDVNDGQNTYFIGHNPGVFSSVMNLQLGDEIVVWDATGASRSYFVFDALVLPNASNYFAYESRLSPTGESITLQTCVADNQNVRCVMAR